MNRRDIVVFGASAGGVEAYVDLFRKLPAHFPAAIFLVLHIPAGSPGMLPKILTAKGRIPARPPEDGEPIRAGNIYVAPPDRHMILARGGIIRVVRGPRENRHRPAIDPLFRSAAAVFGSRVIGAILTGYLDDGSAGLAAVKRRGGVTIVQDPSDALYPGMPSNAIRSAFPDHILPLAEIPELLIRLAGTKVEEFTAPIPRVMSQEVAMAAGEVEPPDAIPPGTPSIFSCPDCGGVLWEMNEPDDFVRYRCRVGHAFSPEAMQEAQQDQLEEALYTALKTLEESANLSHRLARREAENGQQWLAERFNAQQLQAREKAEVIRQVLEQQVRPVSVEDAPGTLTEPPRSTSR